MFECIFQSYSGIVFLVSLGCGALGAASMFKQGRLGDGLLIVSLYAVPPAVSFWGSPFLGDALAHNLPLHRGYGRFVAAVILLPVLLVWVGWLIFGGFMAIEGEVDLGAVLQAHRTATARKNKLYGTALFCVGVAAVVCGSVRGLGGFGPLLWLVAIYSQGRATVYFVFPEEQRLFM